MIVSEVIERIINILDNNLKTIESLERRIKNLENQVYITKKELKKEKC